MNFSLNSEIPSKAFVSDKEIKMFFEAGVMEFVNGKYFTIYKKHLLGFEPYNDGFRIIYNEPCPRKDYSIPAINKAATLEERLAVYRERANILKGVKSSIEKPIIYSKQE